MDAAPASFPRGKKRKSSSSSAPPPSSSKSSSSGGGGSADAQSSSSSSNSKKRRGAASSSSSSAAVAVAPVASADDFLFGNADGDDNGGGGRGRGGGGRRDKSRAVPSASDDYVPGHEYDPDLVDDDGPSGWGNSSLPLGGGAVLPPTTTRASDGSKSKRFVPARIEPLTFGKIARGTKVLGVVREVRDEYALVGLPTMLTGYVTRSSVAGGLGLGGGDGGGCGGGDGDAPPLTRVLPPAGTTMAFCVLRTEEEAGGGNKSGNKSSVAVASARGRRKRRIELCPLPSSVNRGARVDDYLLSNDGDVDDRRHPMVVRGRISSVEDHGCIVDLGLDDGGHRHGGGAFLRFDMVEGGYVVDDGDVDSDDDDGDDDDDGSKEINAASSHSSPSSWGGKDERRRLNVHRVYDFAVLPSNKSPSSSSSSTDGTTTVLQLSLPSRSSLARIRSPPSSMTTLSSLRPGMLAEVRVEGHARNGVCVAFRGGTARMGAAYRGCIDEDHLGGHRGCGEGGGGGGGRGKGDSGMWWKGVFKGRHAKFTARIIAVDTTTKIVRFSINPSVLALDAGLASFPLDVGAVVEGATVIRADPGVGALLALPAAAVEGARSGGTEDEGGASSGEIARIDADLKNNLMSNATYREASRVRAAYVHISRSMDAPDDDGGAGGDRSKKKKRSGGGGNNGDPAAGGTRRARTPEALFARHFALGKVAPRLRILSAHFSLDGIAPCSTAASVVDAHVLTHADVVPGALYEAVPVLRLLDSGGAVVDLGVGTRGIIPAAHLFDRASQGAADGGGGADMGGYRQKVRLAKYRPGSRVSVRCLTVDPSSRSCVLTAKKSLVADGAPPIVDYASVGVGTVSAGFISKVDESGLTVTFYNNVHGRVSSRSLASELGVEDVRVNYGVGDAVAARVVSCERRRNRRAAHAHAHGDDGEQEYYYQLRLSLKTVVEEKRKEGAVGETAAAAGAEGGAAGSTEAAVPLAAGSVLMPKRMKVLQLVKCLRRDDGAFLPGYAVVSIKSKFFTGGSTVPPANSDGAVECKLPYEQLLDVYGSELSSPPVELDGIAQDKLTVGKRIDAEGLVLSVPNHMMDAMPIVSLRPLLIDAIKKKRAASSPSDDFAIICPSPQSTLFTGEYVRGYVARIDKRFGAFVRFLDGLTGLIPKLKRGLDEKLYDTILCRVTALDITSSPPKILLKKVSENEVAKKRRKKEKGNKGKVGGSNGESGGQLQVGQVVGDIKVADINFARAKVYLINDHDDGANESKIRARVHVTMAGALDKKTKLSKKERELKVEHKIGKGHPFYNWKVGDVISDVRCVAVDNRDGVPYVELTNLTDAHLPAVVSDPKHLPPGSILSAIVTSISSTSLHHGLWVQACPGISGFVPALEVSDDPDVLNDLSSHFSIGSRIACCVMEKTHDKKRSPIRQRRHQLQTDDDHDATLQDHQALELSVLLASSTDASEGSNNQNVLSKPARPHRGSIVVGRIHAKTRSMGPPSLMLDLRGNVVGRCCITELADVDDWENMPLGRSDSPVSPSSDDPQRVVSDSDADHPHENNDDDEKEMETNSDTEGEFSDGKYVKCRILGNTRSRGVLEVSLRDSRLKSEANLEGDAVPKPNDMVHAYVVSTTKKGCFIRLSRSVEGRVILKELSDEFIPNPSAMFPAGRLVVGKVKSVTEMNHGKKSNQTLSAMVDVDMRESVLLASGDRIKLDDIKKNSKYTGVVTRVESYGVFVRIDNSDVSGLAHVSECSDSYIKNIFDLYNPGDLVKIIVIEMDKEQKRLAFSLKASNFVDDDSDDESSSSSGSDESSTNEMDIDGDEDGDKDGDDESIDSEDEDFASKLAKKMETGEDMDVDAENSTDGDSSGSSSSGSGGGSESSDSEGEDDDSVEDGKQIQGQEQSLQAMETDVGFDWGGSSKPAKPITAEESSDDDSSSSSDSSDEESDADSGFKSSHKSRKKAAAKKREEEETSRREAALADGTADDAPETSADFERLIAASPNDSETWIRYMAHHLSLADIDSARNVANRAFERIEFRQEGEKLNVWTALLTLELKYGTNKSLHETVDRACQQNNPKQVYLRVCELLDKEVDAAASAVGSADLTTATERSDAMFAKMCKKFRSKKAVWLAHFKYLLKGTRHEEAHALLKRSLQSLPPYKHVEVMNKFAQMEFELGSPERGRTIFNALLEKHPKLDLLFVHIDKEVKNGDISKARALFDSVVNPVSSDRKKFKLSDKQMKSLFKKWYRMEEDHGDEESLERVQEEARAFVSKSN